MAIYEPNLQFIPGKSISVEWYYPIATCCNQVDDSIMKSPIRDLLEYLLTIMTGNSFPKFHIKVVVVGLSL